MPLLDAQAMVHLRRLTFAAAALAVAFSVLGERFGLLDYRPGGSSFDTLVRPIFLGIFVVGLLIAIRWEIVGGIVAGFAAAGIVAFATHQLVSADAALVVAAFAIPAGLWIAIDLHDMSERRAAASLTIALVVAVAGFVLGTNVHDRIWGPTHPDSQVEAVPESPAEWVWSGATDSDSSRVRAKAGTDFENARLAVDTDGSFSDPTWAVMSTRSENVASFDVEGLQPGTRYHYAVEFDGELDRVRTGAFRTFPAEGPATFQVAIGACARVGSNGQVFDTIAGLDPLLYLVLGDLHYGDNDENDIDDYREVMDLTLTRPGQAALYQSTSIAYVWDDHDYGANDSNGASAARTSAMLNYREYVPSYPLAGPTSSIYQAFTIGRVRFLVTDARSSRDPKDTFDDSNKTMLGAEQKEWLKEQLVRASNDYELVVWVNPVPWIADAEAGADHWGGYSTERRELAQHIADNDVDNLLMLSGDAHMAAIDDGTNTNYSTEPGPGFPLMHTAALDRPGSTKGGPYSEGVHAGGGQFATLDIIDEGGPIQVTLTAWDWQGETLLEYRFEHPART